VGGLLLLSYNKEEIFKYAYLLLKL
jgi:hypothetical protein